MLYSKNNVDYGIVADIGGTNARFACANLKTMTLDAIHIYPCKNFTSLSSALKTYQTQYQLQGISRASVAIACPVQGDNVQMTNLNWKFSIQSIQADANFEQFYVMNDFCASAMSLGNLKRGDKI